MASSEGPRAFPEDFTWGTATASHQIEGGNTNNDWWEWEHSAGSPCQEPSGDACDSWNRWPEDVALCKQMGLGSYRFSLEWSRIEPAEGEWSTAAIDHYRRQCEALLAAGIEPIVTFHHFTTPLWLSERGGWLQPEIADRFAEYCSKTASVLGDVMGRACTINEPSAVAASGYILGIFPPGASDEGQFRRVNEVFVDAHRKAVTAIRAAAPGVPVGIALAMSDYQAIDGGEAQLEGIRADMEDVFLEATAGDDFLGIQTYSRYRIGPHGFLGPERGVPTLPLGYEYYPEALAATIRRAWEYTGGKIPLLVTENGIGTDDDEQRVRYVRTALGGVLDCLDDGIDVLGYSYWSLMDNFEWVFGYGPRFGLVEVDRAAPFARRTKPSADWFANVVRANALVG
jgi:beta-glucosidase